MFGMASGGVVVPIRWEEKAELMARNGNRPPRWTLMGIAIIGALLLAPAAVWASHSFTDVPDSNTFHEDIDAIADARVTRGCNPPENTEYCPEDFVTREQMAAFMNRLGALDAGQSPVVDARTVQGLGLFADIVTVEVNNQENNEEECEPTESLRGSDHEFGTFFTTYQLLSTPAGIFTFDVNVAASDRDPTDGLPASGFLICFAMIDGTELPDGTYSLFRIEAHEMAAVSD